jgi:hypothetical protein
MKRFSLKKLKEVEGKEHYRVEISSRFTSLENLVGEVDINRTWETTRENIKISTKGSLGYYELKKHKPWFEKGCSKLLGQRKQAKLHWLQDQRAINGNNLNNISREVSRHFRNKKREYLKDRINTLAMNSKSKNNRDLYGGINEFMRGYQPRSNLVKNENGDCHSIFNRWKNYFPQLLNVHRVSDVRQIEVHTAKLLVHDPNPIEVEIAVAKLKMFKSLGSDQIQAEMIQAGGEILRSNFHKLINSIWNKEKLPDQWKEYVIVPVHKKANKTYCNSYRGMPLLST